MTVLENRLWELRHTRFDRVDPAYDFWYARNRKTGKTVSSYDLRVFANRDWLKSNGLPAYLAKYATGDTLPWWDQLYRTGKAPGFDPDEFASSVKALKKSLRRS